MHDCVLNIVSIKSAADYIEASIVRRYFVKSTYKLHLNKLINKIKSKIQHLQTCQLSVR